MKYKINIHAHSIFSDGINTPYTMALEAKRLGFTALVITDHYYGPTCPDFMSKNSLRLLKKACNEARDILPIIIGMEVPFCGQEVLIFGGTAIKHILDNGLPDCEEMAGYRDFGHCGIVLCHPGEDFGQAAKYVHAFEEYNSGSNLFDNGTATRPFGELEGKQRWCNSDAHMKQCLGKAYNIVGSKIETEADLIKYIKKGHQPEFVVTKQ